MKVVRLVRAGVLAATVFGITGSASARYLQPEPLLQNPRYVQAMAMQGHSVPVYAYAMNNPISYVDPNGLMPMDGSTTDRYITGQMDSIRRNRPPSSPARQAYDNWWKTRPEQFRTWGPLSNAKRFFGNTSAPVCADYARETADGINRRLGDGEGEARDRWLWQDDNGNPIASPNVLNGHNNVRIYDTSGNQVDTFDPWWRLP